MKDLVFKTIMLKGEGGTSIDRIEKTSSSGVVDTYTIYFDDDKEPQTFEVTNGYSIISIEKTATLGNVDTYTVSLDNGDTYTFDVTNSNVADSMTAQDETTVGPSMRAAKDFINKVTDADGILFCGDFINVPDTSLIGSATFPQAAIYALGWSLPPWVTWEQNKGLKVDKTADSFNSLRTPKYRNRSITLADNGIDKVVVSVEWSKDGDNTIHTSTAVVNNTTASYSWNIVELEPNIFFKITNFYAYPDSADGGGTTLFGIDTSGNTIQGDYYIRKIKMEKGEIATPFGLNKDQFFALQYYYDLVNPLRTRIGSLESKVLELTGTITTDSSGNTMTSGALPNGWTLSNTYIMAIEIKVGDEVYLNTFNGSGYVDNKDVVFSAKLRTINNVDNLVLLFKDPTQANATLHYKVALYKSDTSFT